MASPAPKFFHIISLTAQFEGGGVQRRRRRLADKELGHLLTRSSITLLEVSRMVSPGFSRFLVRR